MKIKPEKKPKKRLDQLLTERGFADSMEKAKRMIMAGTVFSGTEVLSKPGLLFEEDILLSIISPLKYVSRGGLKLEGFMKGISLDINGFKCLDIGSSTGGFTDYMLQNGALKVVCVDVGQGILHWKIRNDKRVEVHENINARYLDSGIIGFDFDLIIIDVSFISLKLIIPAAAPLLKMSGYLICLIKPQFEAERPHVKKGGVVKSKEVQLSCVEDIKNFIEHSGFLNLNVLPSALKGPAGNQEYFIAAKKTTQEALKILKHNPD